MGMGLGLRETGACLEFLEIALAEREPYLGSVMVFPGYDVMRDHKGFRRLAEELKLPT